jgi:hypothetical protein
VESPQRDLCGEPAEGRPWRARSLLRRPGSPQFIMARALHVRGLRLLPRGEPGPLAFLLESPAVGLSTVPSSPGSPRLLVARALHDRGLRLLPRGDPGPLAFWRARRSGSPRCLLRRALHGSPWRGLSTLGACGSCRVESPAPWPLGEPSGRALHGAYPDGLSTVHHGFWRARRWGSPRCLLRRALHGACFAGLSTVYHGAGSPGQGPAAPAAWRARPLGL